MSSRGSPLSMDDLERSHDDETISQGMRDLSPQDPVRSVDMTHVWSMSMQQFRDAADKALVMELTPVPIGAAYFASTPKQGSSPNKAGTLTCLPRFLLTMYGFIPWLPKRQDAAYCITVSRALLCISGHATFLSFAEPDSRDEYLPIACLALGSFFAVADLHWHEFRFRFEVLSYYMTFYGYEAEWHRKSLRRFVPAVCIGGCLVLSKSLLWVRSDCQISNQDGDAQTVLHFVSLVVICGALIAMTHCHSNVDLALELCVERCAVDYAQMKDRHASAKHGTPYKRSSVKLPARLRTVFLL